MSLMPGPKTSMPMSAYTQQEVILKKDRCTNCNGLGWTVWKHSYPNNEYHQCPMCGGNGRKRQPVQDEPKGE
jgi:hypothetical protein